MVDNDQLTEISKTLAVVETEVKGVNRRLDGIDHRFDKLNNSQDKQWEGINKNQLALGKVMERTHLSPCVPLQTHSDDKEAHGVQAAQIDWKGRISVALIAGACGVMGGLIQAVLH